MPATHGAADNRVCIAVEHRDVRCGSIVIMAGMKLLPLPTLIDPFTPSCTRCHCDRKLCKGVFSMWEASKMIDLRQQCNSSECAPALFCIMPPSDPLFLCMTCRELLSSKPWPPTVLGIVCTSAHGIGRTKGLFFREALIQKLDHHGLIVSDLRIRNIKVSYFWPGMAN